MIIKQILAWRENVSKYLASSNCHNEKYQKNFFVKNPKTQVHWSLETAELLLFDVLLIYLQALADYSTQQKTVGLAWVIQFSKLSLLLREENKRPRFFSCSLRCFQKNPKFYFTKVMELEERKKNEAINT